MARQDDGNAVRLGLHAAVKPHLAREEGIGPGANGVGQEFAARTATDRHRLNRSIRVADNRDRFGAERIADMGGQRAKGLRRGQASDPSGRAANDGVLH